MKNEINKIALSQSIIAEVFKTSKATVNRMVKEKKLRTAIVDNNKKSKKYDISSIHKIGQQLYKKRHIEKKVHAFYNLKGGTGKTSICAQISVHLALMGYKILVIDCDPQAHMTVFMGFREDCANSLTLYDVIINRIDAYTAIQKVCTNIDIILSNLSLSRLEVPLSQKPRREEKLKDLIKYVGKDYDYVMIDTNPSFSNINLNTLYASDQINFVTETAPFSLYGLRIMIEECYRLFEDMKKTFSYKIIPNKYESKTALAQEILGNIRANYKEHVMNSVIRKCEDINKASMIKQPIVNFCNKKSPAFEDIIDLIEDFLKESSTTNNVAMATRKG